jgi:nucleotidyltransferase/DNA polymerase involved in DNA repair
MQEALEFARRCPQRSPLGSAPSSCSSRQGSMFIAKCPNRFERSSRTTPRGSSRSLSLSLDEAYLDVTDNLRGLPTAWETAKEIRARIHEETKLTASAGISCNRFLAKIASDYRKPNGQFAMLSRTSE